MSRVYWNMFDAYDDILNMFSHIPLEASLNAFVLSYCRIRLSRTLNAKGTPPPGNVREVKAPSEEHAYNKLHAWIVVWKLDRDILHKQSSNNLRERERNMRMTKTTKNNPKLRSKILFIYLRAFRKLVNNFLTRISFCAWNLVNLGD